MAAYVGTPEADIFQGTSDNDTFTGISFNDSVDGGAGTDVISIDLSAATANIQYSAHLAGNATGWTALGMLIRNVERLSALHTGSGNDTLIIAYSHGPFVWHAGGGNDTARISYTAAPAGTSIIAAPQSDGGYAIDIAGFGTTVLYDVEVIDLDGGAGNDSLTGTVGTDRLDGGIGDDTLSGGLGNDVLGGTSGNDLLIGGGGGDYYDIGENEHAVIVENDEQRDGDTIRVIAERYTLPDNFENLSLHGNYAYGNAQNNIIHLGTPDEFPRGSLYGLEGDDVLYGDDESNGLDGGTGADTMYGGFEMDYYTIDNPGDVAIEEDGQEYIEAVIRASIDFTLDDAHAYNIDSLELTGNAIRGTGNDRGNSIKGNSENNILDGRGGRDYLEGGAGNDTYIVEFRASNPDRIVETANKGIDTVMTAGTFSLPAHVENLTLTSIGDDNGTGNDLGNLLIGNAGVNILTGGLGDDTYVLMGGNDTVVEKLLEGLDTVETDATYTLGNHVENLTLTGDGNVNGTGNLVANVLTGNAGVNTLTGGRGNDTYYIQNATDRVVELHTEGTDTIFSSVSYSLFGRAIETFIMTGTADLTVTGNSLNNSLTGNDGNNSFDGGTGADRMAGGLGNDTYYVDHVQDNVAELHLQGNDTVFSSVTYSLFGRAVETLILTGDGNLNGTGNSLANTITGTAGNNSLDGGAGADVLKGGLGDDTYYVDHAQDNVVEQHGQGTDTVYATVTYSLFGRAAESLILTGSGNLNGTGNSLNNVLTGNDGNNTLNGGGGRDLLTGGLGADIFLFTTGAGRPTITDFNSTEGDSIDIHAYTHGVSDISRISQSGEDVTITLIAGPVITVTHANVGDVMDHIVW
ncbi:hypothetical protein ABAC460_10680 [Asticcacaulis sp. AC460]|uniref:calcium-binding protein n=1 Tax=Asticcacaulis sp. AC460 TaxID=1282360 RepID=UPI0003C3BC34|nr:calcium-binding protein [Asticcacaulis sp. AC460]ESQ90207.1 hypothetical protein ABAC460_10680 [Asticcacaulis sp. AC460]